VRILSLLALYRPHVSGLTLAAAQSAELFASRGHQVTVLTSRHDPRLAEEEMLSGVRVERVPAPWRISKGPILRGYGRRLRALLPGQDVVLLWLPATPIEMLTAAWACRRAGVPLVAHTACDLRLHGGPLARFIEAGVFACQHVAARAAAAMVSTTEDYALASPFQRRYRRKLTFIPLPIRISQPDPVEISRLRAAHAPLGEKLIGIAGRLSAEKGFEFLADALPAVRERFPGARVLHAGVLRAVGESAYGARMLPRLAAMGDAWHTLGVVEPDLASFYAACDVLVLPSVNRMESFGMVQVEAMLCGTPVVASALPGVRVPVLTTGMGKLVEPGNPASIAAAVIEILSDRQRFVRPREAVEREYSLEAHYAAYMALLTRLVGHG
jgi:glycosyltransferase involved in cell wall biosynthesis